MHSHPPPPPPAPPHPTPSTVTEVPFEEEQSGLVRPTLFFLTSWTRSCCADAGSQSKLHMCCYLWRMSSWNARKIHLRWITAQSKSAGSFSDTLGHFLIKKEKTKENNFTARDMINKIISDFSPISLEKHHHLCTTACFSKGLLPTWKTGEAQEQHSKTRPMAAA